MICVLAAVYVRSFKLLVFIEHCIINHHCDYSVAIGGLHCTDRGEKTQNNNLCIVAGCNVQQLLVCNVTHYQQVGTYNVILGSQCFWVIVGQFSESLVIGL